jgi:hypothetical protein
VKLTAPGPTDLHWMVVLLSSDGRHTFDFHETQEAARTAALALLTDTPGTSVYVTQIHAHGEHLRRRAPKKRPPRPAVCDDDPQGDGS